MVCAAAIAYSAGHVETTARLCITILGTVAVYWVAHLHAVTIGNSLTHRHHPLAAVRHAFVETLPIAGASVVPLAILLLTTLVSAPTCWHLGLVRALVATIALLAIYSYIAGARGGLDARGEPRVCAWPEQASGLLVVGLKVALH